MSAFLAFRFIGLILFAFVGFYVGAELATMTALSTRDACLLFLLIGAVFGAVVTPWITVKPWRHWRRSIGEMPVSKLLMSIVGGLVGLLLALLLAFPLSLLGDPMGKLFPTIISLACAFAGMTVFNTRSGEILEAIGGRVMGRQRRIQSSRGARALLLDTSVLIDGRIVEIAETGFIGGTLIIPRFVLSELHRVADSSDALRRNRGRRGLAKLNELQRHNNLPVKIVDDDPIDFAEVDAKLVALAIQLDASLVTNDFNLNQVADAQGVDVLNINALSNAVRSVYIPGETFDIRIIQEGRDPNQGVGYLDDGTMVVVESGQKYMDRNIGVEVTKLINRPTGRMIFAVPEAEAAR